MPSVSFVRKDDLNVHVAEWGDFEKALKKIHVMWKNSDVPRALRFRAQFPSRSDRRREKARRAAARRTRGPH